MERGVKAFKNRVHVAQWTSRSSLARINNSIYSQWWKETMVCPVFDKMTGSRTSEVLTTCLTTNQVRVLPGSVNLLQLRVKGDNGMGSVTKMTGLYKYQRSCGAMDNASDYESEDCRFESCQDRNHLLLLRRTGTKAWVVACKMTGLYKYQRSCGAMDNASDYESEDCRFESCQNRLKFLVETGCIYF
jgi:hypothetical protein